MTHTKVKEILSPSDDTQHAHTHTHTHTHIYTRLTDANIFHFYAHRVSYADFSHLSVFTRLLLRELVAENDVQRWHTFSEVFVRSEN